MDNLGKYEIIKIGTITTTGDIATYSMNMNEDTSKLIIIATALKDNHSVAVTKRGTIIEFSTIEMLANSVCDVNYIILKSKK